MHDQRTLCTKYFSSLIMHLVDKKRSNPYRLLSPSVHSDDLLKTSLACRIICYLDIFLIVYDDLLNRFRLNKTGAGFKMGNMIFNDRVMGNNKYNFNDYDKEGHSKP